MQNLRVKTFLSMLMLLSSIPIFAAQPTLTLNNLTSESVDIASNCSSLKRTFAPDHQRIVISPSLANADNTITLNLRIDTSMFRGLFGSNMQSVCSLKLIKSGQNQLKISRDSIVNYLDPILCQSEVNDTEILIIDNPEYIQELKTLHDSSMLRYITAAL